MTTVKVHKFLEYETFLMDNITFKKILSTLRATLVNAFLCHFGKKWLSECPLEFFPNHYKRYTIDISVAFDPYTQLLKFVDYMNNQHSKILLTFEVE